MERHEDSALRQYEEKARELVDLTLDICESRVSKEVGSLLWTSQRQN